MKINYFAHDYGARHSPKLISLQMAMGGVGLAIFWCLIEMLWENAGYYPCTYDIISFHLHWAKPEEIRRVVEEFDLFLTNGEVFWSESVLRRMKIRDEISEKRVNSGRAGGIRSGVSRREAKASVDGSTGEANASNRLSNKEINIEKETNKESITNNEEEERKKIYELFFFKNFLYPRNELERFWDYYSGRGWETGDGKPIVDRICVANNWKPEKKERRFDLKFLGWYKGIYSAVKNHNVLKDPLEMLTGLTRVNIFGDQSMEIAFKTAELAETVRAFVQGNHLQGPYKIDYRVNTD